VRVKNFFAFFFFAEYATFIFVFLYLQKRKSFNGHSWIAKRESQNRI